MIISRTPFRISFFGGGTDYPAWYREHGGAVLTTLFVPGLLQTERYAKHVIEAAGVRGPGRAGGPPAASLTAQGIDQQGEGR